MTQDNDDFLAAVYELDTPEAARDLYDRWAGSYDADLTAAGYATPDRVAGALARHAGTRVEPVLDFGCGTGLSGAALAAAGFATIDGVDISAGMLAQARAGGHYRRLWLAEPGAPLPCGEAAYTLAAAAGAISPGAAPPEAFDLVWSALRPGGIFALSLNDMALQARDYEARVAEHADCGAAEVLEREHGAHVPAEGVGAVVYVLRKR